MRKVECPGLKLRVGSDGCGLEEVFYGERDEGFRIDEDAVNIGEPVSTIWFVKSCCPRKHNAAAVGGLVEHEVH